MERVCGMSGQSKAKQLLCDLCRHIAAATVLQRLQRLPVCRARLPANLKKVMEPETLKPRGLGILASKQLVLFATTCMAAGVVCIDTDPQGKGFACICSSNHTHRQRDLCPREALAAMQADQADALSAGTANTEDIAIVGLLAQGIAGLQMRAQQ